MLWQILILTKPSRKDFLKQLLSLLEPQIDVLGLRKFDQVDILIHEDNWQEPPFMGVGGKREVVKQKATGDYINWFDDDDLPAKDYISSVLPLLDGVDYIGWESEVYIDKRKQRRDFHTISVPGWWDEPDAYHRDISHLNPVRRDLAMQKSFSGPVGEDHRWADAMRPLIKTEHYLDKIMYYYFSRQTKNDAKDPFDPWRLEWLNKLRP